jgi:putative oxidoreductase
MTTLRSDDLAKAVLRGAIGAILVGHGTQKLFGWFGGGGIAGTGAGMHRMGFRPGPVHAAAAGAVEAGGGAALLLGLATPAAGGAAAVAMGVAAGAQAANGFFASKNGLEYPAVLGVAAVVLAIAGPGRLSVDALTGHVLDRPWMRAVGVAVVPVAIAVQLHRRRRVLAAERSPAGDVER